MKNALSFASALALLGLASAQQPEYAQCGGINWTGGTTCVSPYVCTVENPYYYQCLPGTSTTTTTTTHTTTTSTHTTTTTSHTTTTGTTSTKSTTTTSGSVITAPTGFVSVSSSPSPHFVLGGKPFYFGGTNAYYIPQLDAAADMESVFQTMNSLGLTVVRVWAFNEVTATQNYGAYYQLWNGATPTINLGPNGFDRLDSTLQLAGQYGVKVILTLTNNWSDFGGSDVYVHQILGSSATHDQFYSNSQVIAAFKNYVEFVVQRYASNSNVFSWELMNEPRCAGSTGSPSSACNSALITSWVSNISAYIKSLDSNHLVTVGDEGFFCWTNTTDYIYDCGTGGDSNSYSKISSIDWLTFHMYPESWGETSPSVTAWGETWITQHAYVQQASGKPAVLEEFGITDGDATKATTYSAWFSTVEQYKLGGAMYWQLGNADTEVTDYTQSDGDTVFCPSYTATCPVIQAFAEAMAALSP